MNQNNTSVIFSTSTSPAKTLPIIYGIATYCFLFLSIIMALVVKKAYGMDESNINEGSGNLSENSNLYLKHGYKNDRGYTILGSPFRHLNPEEIKNLNYIHTEPNFVDFAEDDLSRGYEINSKGFIQRKTMPYVYRADTRKFSEIKTQDGFGESLNFASGTMLNKKVPTLIASRSADGAYKFGIEELKKSGHSFTIYRIDSLGIITASLEENVLHTDVFSGYHPFSIFEGSYYYRWDEVHIKAPVPIERITVLAEFE